MCGKTNVLTYVYDLWERAFHEMGQKDFADIERDYYHVDATCMWMVKNPEWFDVIVTGNMFGDIITDLGAIIQGGMGIAAGGNINPEGVSHVRADRGYGAEVYGQERDQSAGGDLCGGDDAGNAGRGQGGDCGGRGGEDGDGQQAEEPGGRQDGLLDHRGGRPCGGGAEVSRSMR